MNKDSGSLSLKSKAIILLPLCFFAIYDSAISSFAPILQKLSIQFPEASITLIQMAIALPTVTYTPTALLVGLFATYYKKKRIAQFALIILFLGGLSPIFFHESIYTLLISSAFIGIGQGLIAPLTHSIISEHFNGNERGTAMGINKGANYLGAALLTLIIGRLALLGWYNAYWVYFLVIPVFIITSVFLPEGELDQKLLGKNVGLKGIKNVFTPALIYMVFVLFTAALLMFTFYTSIAMLVVEKGLGNMSEATNIISFNSIAGLIAGLSFGFLLKIFKKYVLSIGFASITISFFLLFFSNNLTTLIISGILFGLGAGLQEVGGIYFVSESVPKSSITLAMSITIAGIGVGISLSPIAINSIKQFFWGTTTISSGILLAGFGYLILFIVETIREKIFNKNSTIGLHSSNRK